MSNLNELKPVGKLNPFAHFCCTIGNLPTSYVASLSYEEQLWWLCDYLEKTVIPAVNNNAEAVLELQNLYAELKSYVDNYFNNLDVQQEINNKLDTMAQDGTLEKIINQDIFNTINENVANLNNEVNTINNTLNDENYNGTVLIGDSYGQGATYNPDTLSYDYINSWFYYLKQAMHLKDNEVFEWAEGGAGMLSTGTEGHTFGQLLSSHINEIPNKNLIKQVICCGGYNDRNQPLANLPDAVKNFVQYCRAQFPNAKIYIGSIGYDTRIGTTGQTNRNLCAIKVLSSYSYANVYGGILLKNVNYCLHDNSLMSADGYHPNHNGYYFLGHAIYSAINGNYSLNNNVYFGTVENSQNYNLTDDSSLGQTNIVSSLSNGDISDINFQRLTLKFNTPITLNTQNEFIVGLVNIDNFRSTVHYEGKITLPVFIADNQQHLYKIVSQLYIDNDNKLRIVPMDADGSTSYKVYNNISVIQIPLMSITIPTRFM